MIVTSSVFNKNVFVGAAAPHEAPGTCERMQHREGKKKANYYISTLS